MTIATRPLGRTGVQVTVLGYGAMELRGAPRGPAISDDEAGRLLHAVLDGGINLIDTSIDYGRSEELIGRYLANRREDFFLASKCGCPHGSRLTLRGRQIQQGRRIISGRAHDYRPASIRAGTEQSLRRLRTDRLDLLQVHMSPSRAQLEADDTVQTLLSLRAAGKVRFIGMSGQLPHLPDHIAMGVFDVFQIPYSALQPEHEDLISAAAAAGAGTLIRGGAARGAPAQDKNWQGGPIGLTEGEGRRRWQASGVQDLLGGMSPMEFVLRFTLSHRGLSSTIVGTSRVSHLRANLAFADRGPLPAGLYQEARKRLRRAAEEAAEQAAVHPGG
jgi:aryl-alcohol dehydrogenase-like predicted oxidoreductase